MSSLAELLSGSLAGGSLLTLPLALLGGVVAGLNPCCFPLYPAAAATCCATRSDCTAQGARKEAVFSRALAFVLGTALATSALGLVAALLGQTMVGLGGLALYFVALVPLFMGCALLGWLPLPKRKTGGQPVGKGVTGAFVAGFLLSLVLAPCGTPILASVLSYAAYQGSVPYGGVLLFLYGLGAGLPVLLIGTFAGELAQRLDARGFRRRIDQGTGVILLGVGFYLLWEA